jgi:hypothetical protein
MLGALALHAGAALVRLESSEAAVAPRGAPVPDEMDISIERGRSGPVPGGGADRADPAGTDGRADHRLPKAPPKSAPAARVAPRAADPNPHAEGPSASPEPDVVPASVSPVSPAVKDEADPFASLPRPKPARTRRLEARAPQREGNGLENTGRSPGSGLGTGSGPGGPGRGSGVVSGRFAFGGPTGSFRADVCFFEPPVRTLADIRECEPAGTFFTDQINVAPRSFTNGFPGLTARTEWFRIEYRGKFSVRAADYYRFRLLSDDGAILYVDGYRIIDNDGQHAPTSREMTITLEAGEHEIRVSYWQGPRENIALQLFVKQYNHAERLFSPAL